MRLGAALLLCFGAAVVVAAEFIVVGLIPAMTADLAIGPAEAGWLVTLFAIASALLGPALVAATARLPSALMLGAALLPFAANLLLLPFPSFAVAAALRLLQGAALPLFISLASAQLAATRGAGHGVALLYVGVTIGGTFAPPLGTFAAERLGWEAPMAAIGVFALAGAAGCLLLGHDGSSDEREDSWRVLLRPSLRTHLLLSVLLFATMFVGFSYIALLLQRAGLGGDATAFALLGFGAAGLAGNWLAGATARWSLPATHLVALVAAGATVWLIAAPALQAPVLIAIPIWGMAHAAGFVFCQVRVMSAVPEAPSFGGSLNISAANIGIAIGSFAGGYMIERGGLAGLALLALVSALASVVVTRRIAFRENAMAARAAP